jgi:nicotinamide mononucleotide transporter
MAFSDFLDGLKDYSPAEVSAVVLAIAYLVLAIREHVLCWAAAFVSSLIYLFVFYSARLYTESLLQIFYAAMAIYGYYQWKFGGEHHSRLKIGIAAATASIGWLMSHTDAAFPYADAFTTSAAIVTTYMVARKVLENWLYWFVIDSVSVVLYLARGLELTALLFVLYLLLIVVGMHRWWHEWRSA